MKSSVEGAVKLFAMFPGPKFVGPIFEHFAHERDKIQALLLKLYLAAADARNIEELIDNTRELFSLPLDRR